MNRGSNLVTPVLTYSNWLIFYKNKLQKIVERPATVHNILIIFSIIVKYKNFSEERSGMFGVQDIKQVTYL